MTDISSLVHELFVPAHCLVAKLETVSDEQEAIRQFNADHDGHWLKVKIALQQLDPEALPGNDLREAVGTIARIHEGTRTQCNTNPEVAIYIFRRLVHLKRAATRGWTAATHGGTIPEDPFPIDAPLPATEDKPDYNESAQKSFTMLERFAATESGHLAFIESVRNEVGDAARRKQEGDLPRKTMENTVDGICVTIPEARQRLAALANLPTGIVKQVDSVLRREVTVGTLEQIYELLTPAVRALRDAWEFSNNEQGDMTAGNEFISLPAEEMAEANETKPPQLDGKSNSHAPTGYLSGKALIEVLGIDPTRSNAFLRQLVRKRTELGDDFWHEVNERRPNSPKFLYRADSPKLRQLATAYKSSKST